MRESKQIRLVGCLVIAGCLALSMASAALAAGGRTYPPRPAAPVKPQTAPAATAGPEVPTPKEATLGDDLEQNIKALQQEKLDLIRQRVALLNQAFAAGQVSQTQLDQATVEQLHQELEVIDRPQLRVIALEQLVTILRRFEDDAKQNLTETATGKKSNDVSRAASAHGRYVGARLRRIDTQIRLEKEKLAIKNEGQKIAEPPKTTATTTPR